MKLLYNLSQKNKLKTINYHRLEKAQIREQNLVFSMYISEQLEYEQ